MITSGIFFKNFQIKRKTSSLKKDLKSLFEENNNVIQSLNKNYKDNFKKKNLRILKKIKDVRLIGMGGSSLGTKAIYSFLKSKIKKNFLFQDNLNANSKINEKKKYLNLVVSKSGNTIETIINANIYIKKKR